VKFGQGIVDYRLKKELIFKEEMQKHTKYENTK
jgi:hypothetical protein